MFHVVEKKKKTRKKYNQFSIRIYECVASDQFYRYLISHLVSYNRVAVKNLTIGKVRENRDDGET